MRVEALANTKGGKFIAKIAGAMMENRFRYWFAGPMKILQGSDIQAGQAVLEVGCGTGFHTVAAAQLLGDQGSLVAIDLLSDYIERVKRKVQAAELTNVSVLKRDGMETCFDAESFDTVLLFSVIPSPSLPLKPFLSEMHRVLKPQGSIAVTTFPWMHQVIRRSELFTFISKRNGVYNYRRC